MDNFEKRLVCKYLIKYIEFFDLDTRHFPKLYDSIILNLKLDKRKVSLYKSRMDFDEELTFNKNLITIIAEKLSKLQIKSSVLEKKCKLIKDIFVLDKYEYKIFVYYILKTINPIVRKFSISIPTNDEFEFFCTNFLNISSWIIDLKRKSLITKGIFLKRGIREDSVFLNPKIVEIFENEKITTKIQIKNVLLGKNQKSILGWDDFKYMKNERDMALNILISAISNKTKGINILLYGDVGTGKTQFAKLLANKAKVDQYLVSSNISNSEMMRIERLSDLHSKQTILSKINNSCILFDEAEDVMNRGFSEFGNASKAHLNTLLEETPVPVFWTTNNIHNVDPAFLRRMTYAIEFNKLNDDIRLNIWKSVIKKNKLKIDSKKLIELNKNYDISPSLITNAVSTTKLINGTQDDFEIFVENIARVVTKKKNVKIKKEFEMSEYSDNLVNTDFDINDLTSKIKACGKLNFSLCLYGEPGTGKSLYARYLAKELGIEIILKRASDLISKYVGETEQNIAEAFAEAKEKGAMLIFDEADSFLQNRNNAVRNWEVSQVNEMLTWMESHEYPFICTTNLLDTLDEASLRRFTFKIKFDFMTSNQVKLAMEHFFGIENTNLNIKGLTAGDFATVKKKADFLRVTHLNELTKMLEDEVKVKKSKELQNSVGF